MSNLVGTQQFSNGQPNPVAELFVLDEAKKNNLNLLLLSTRPVQSL